MEQAPEEMQLRVKEQEMEAEAENAAGVDTNIQSRSDGRTTSRPDTSNDDAQPQAIPASASANQPDSETLPLTPTAALFTAARTNDVPTLTTLLTPPVSLSPEWETRDGITALGIALLNANPEAVQLLLSHGADPNHRVDAQEEDTEGRQPPLVLAALSRAHGPELCELLLEHGAVPDAVCGPEGRTALHFAAAGGAAAVVRYLAGRQDVDLEMRCVRDREHTALTLASREGNEDVVRALCEAGVSLGVKTVQGGAALHWASGNGQAAVVRVLIEAGVGIESGDQRGYSALTIASELGHAEVVQVLLDAGADINARAGDAAGYTPLMLAAGANEVEVVRLLMARGADMDALTDEEKSVLDVAVFHRAPDAIEVLLEALGGKDYPKKSVALQLALANGFAATKALMTVASVMHSQLKEPGETDEYAWIGWVLKQGGNLVEQLAMAKMLPVAVRENDVGMVKELVSHGCCVDRQLESKTSTLGFAVKSRWLDIVQVLLDAGADPNQTMCVAGKGGGAPMTVFDYAVVHRQDDDQVLSALLDSGRCRINKGVDREWTAFSLVLRQIKDPVTRESATDLAERMVLSVPDVNEDRSGDGFTLLHVAAYHQNIWMVDLLLARGADLEATSRGGSTPFLIACGWDPDFALQLLQRGANLQARIPRTNATALHMMAIRGAPFLHNLIEMGLDINEQTLRGDTPLTYALDQGFEDLALTLMENGAHVDWKTNGNETALHFAAHHGLHAVTDRVLEQDVDVNVVNSAGWTSLHEACVAGDTYIVARLLDAGADIELPLPNGDRPLHCALIEGKEDVALLLLERGADPTATASNKRTPLHLAAAFDLPGVTRVLLGPSDCPMIEASDDEDHTPLCCTGDPAIVDMLLKAGANVNYADKDGWTPLHQAVHAGDARVAVRLVLAGAGLDARTKDDGLTAMERAMDLWRWSRQKRVVRPRLLLMAKERREDRQRREEYEGVGGPFEIIE